jgi:hypothetical protein
MCEENFNSSWNEGVHLNFVQVKNIRRSLTS